MRTLLTCIAAVLLLALTVPAAEIALLRNGFEIRHARREVQGENTRLYLSDTPESGFLDVPTEEIVSFQHDDAPVRVSFGSAEPASPASTTPAAAPAASPGDVQHFISVASDRHQVDADLIASVIHAESGFHARAVSPKGAQGLMQLMPSTAAQLGVKDPFQPESNIDGGTRYLRDLLVRYNDDIPKALAAYNAGPERVERYGGLPPFHETHAYVARVIRDFNRKKLQANPRLQAAKPAEAKPAASKAASHPLAKKRPAARPRPKTVATVAAARQEAP
jgi:hypothetical protein